MTCNLVHADAKVFETEDDFVQRVEGIMTLFGACVQVRLWVAFVWPTSQAHLEYLGNFIKELAPTGCYLHKACCLASAKHSPPD